MDSGVWNYNMGLVNAQLKNLPLARYHLLEAKKLGAETSELTSSIALVESQLNVSRLETPINGSDQLINIAMTLSEGPLITISLVFLIIGLWLIKRMSSYKSVLITLAMVITPLGLNYWVANLPMKIVLNDQIILEGPSQLFPRRGEVPAGVLIVTRPKGEWEEIIFPARFGGWIRSSGLRTLGQK
jgi:hypothetical protein